ncbi:capsular polysaccharide synthesis protein [Salinisphaera sp. SPP-AMP-43]|uniref:capsular polysaccharide synthesis protein n=1 Tax=Salinisphaera sp. SPP-AMP-43 TaxID=3121288 RepID=UPI003C6E86ED
MPINHPGPGPRNTLQQRLRHRYYVRRTDRQDRKCRSWIGLDTFVDDWQHAMGLPRPRSVAASNRTLWLLWSQGEKQAPPLVRYCIESWRRMNPGWTVRVLDGDALATWTNLPRLPSHVATRHIANIGRLALLRRYGGVWADATSLALKPLDLWLGAVKPTGFFAFRWPQPLRELANWFIAADAGHPLVEAWLRWSVIYLRSRWRPASYFWSHFTFNWLVRHSTRLRLAWDNVPAVSARGPHVMQRILDGHVSGPDLPSAEALATLPLFKMNWKKGYAVDQIRDQLARFGLPDPAPTL